MRNYYTILSGHNFISSFCLHFSCRTASFKARDESYSSFRLPVVSSLKTVFQYGINHTPLHMYKINIGNPLKPFYALMLLVRMTKRAASTLELKYFVIDIHWLLHFYRGKIKYLFILKGWAHAIGSLKAILHHKKAFTCQYFIDVPVSLLHSSKLNEKAPLVENHWCKSLIEKYLKCLIAVQG